MAKRAADADAKKTKPPPNRDAKLTPAAVLKAKASAAAGKD